MKTRLCLTLAVLAVAVGGCKYNEDPVFDPRTMTGRQRDASQQIAPAKLIPLSDTFDKSFQEGGPDAVAEARRDPILQPLDQQLRIVPLDLRTAIQRAIINNTALKVEGYNPAIDETRVIEAEGRFDPTFFQNFSFESNDRNSVDFVQSNGGLSPDSVSVADDISRTILSQTGIRQLLRSGGEISLQYNASRTAFQTDRDPNPAYESELQLSITQPLLRDFGNEINRARIVINRQNQQISLLTFRLRIEETLFNLEQLYWQLLQAQREFEIQSQLLQSTLDTSRILIDRRNQDVTSLQINQAQASVEQRAAQLVRARSRVADLSDRIKQLMNDPDMPVAAPISFTTGTAAVTQQVIFDPQEQMTTAFAFRADIGQQILRIDSAATALGVAKNNIQPKLDVVTSVGIQGLEDNFGDALSDQLGVKNINFSLGLQLEIPLGNRAARSVYRRAFLQRIQSMAQYDELASTATLEVGIAIREVDTTWEEITRSRRAVFAAQQSLDAINVREREGQEPLTPTFVDLKLNQQERYAEAQRQEAAAISNYNIALAQLERAKGTLLRYNNVLLDEDPQGAGIPQSKS